MSFTPNLDSIYSLFIPDYAFLQEQFSVIMFHPPKSSQHDHQSNELYTESKIEELKAAIGPLSGRSLKYCTDACLRGYLQVQNWNHEVAKQAETGIMYRASFHDRQGRTVLVMKPGMPRKSSMEDGIRLQVYLTENAVLNFPEGQQQMTWLVDFSEFSLTKSVSTKLAKQSIHILQSHYPDRLAMAIVYNPPRIFEAFWKIVKCFLDNKTFEKVKFVYPNNKDSVDFMNSYFDFESLPTQFGGNATFKYDHNHFSRLMAHDDFKTAAFWATDDDNL
ncbi:random slug protein 5-like [Senna tora]|uniref:Random slug protein 5-like n=1 Tax=Senna tora TaxID=362788 RepID=A0A834U026_9FABA|nr:random slug protein 5-like [Senna tora]